MVFNNKQKINNGLLFLILYKLDYIHETLTTLLIIFK